MVALKRGFNEIVPASFMDMFDERELELLLSGLGAVDIEDWRRNTEYRHCSPSTQVVQWFWHFVETQDNEMRARLLQFVTGTSRVPVTGFRDLMVTFVFIFVFFGVCCFTSVVVGFDGTKTVYHRVFA